MSSQQDMCTAAERETLRRVLQRRYPLVGRRSEKDKNTSADDALIDLLAADLGKKSAEELVNVVLQPMLRSSALQETDQSTCPSLYRCDRQRLLLACRYFHKYFPAGSSSPSMAGYILKHGLNFQSIKLSEEHCQAVNSVLHRHHASVAIVNLHFSRIGDTGYELLTSGLSECRNLQYLHLDGNYLSDHHTPHIASLIQANHRTLQVITAAQNPISGAGSLQLHKHTDSCSGLKGVVLGGSDSIPCVVNFTKILRACPLQVLSLRDCAIGNAGLSALEMFLEARALTGLDLVKAGLDRESASAVSRVLGYQQHTLVTLALSGNALGDDFLRDVGPALGQCRRLERLSLQDTSLTSASLEIVASLVRTCQSLQELHLAGNDFSDSAACHDALFVSAVTASLSVLEMPEEKLLDPELRAVLRADSMGVECAVQYVPLDAYLQAEEAEQLRGSGCESKIEDGKGDTGGSGGGSGGDGAVTAAVATAAKSPRARRSRTMDGRTQDGRNKEGRQKDGHNKEGRAKDGRNKDGRAKDARTKESRTKASKSSQSSHSNSTMSAYAVLGGYLSGMDLSDFLDEPEDPLYVDPLENIRESILAEREDPLYVDPLENIRESILAEREDPLYVDPLENILDGCEDDFW